VQIGSISKIEPICGGVSQKSLLKKPGTETGFLAYNALFQQRPQNGDKHKEVIPVFVV
jgi:hypothetical protein